MKILQPLFIVDLVAYQKQNRDLQRLKEIKSKQVYQNIPFEITKSSIALFVAEILYKSVSEHESYPEMYDFIKNSLLYFDLMEEGASNFHLWFLVRLTEYLGFLPDTTQIGFQGWFDFKKGVVSSFEPSHPFYANKEVTARIVELASLKIANLRNFRVNREMRDSLLSVLTQYYQAHFEGLGEIKSLNVLREVFL